MWSLARVGEQVIIQRGFYRKALGTQVAFVRFFTCVGAQVNSQCVTFFEAVVAYAALIRPLTRVRAQVGVQRDFLCEALRAQMAFKRSLASVDPQVPRQVRNLICFVAAGAAAVAAYLMRLLSCTKKTQRPNSRIVFHFDKKSY